SLGASRGDQYQPSLKSVTNPKTSRLSSLEIISNEGEYDIKSIPKASDFYDDDDFRFNDVVFFK
ncbi:hypothetical protein CEXT_208671, partial [Caerostris extrusa]